MGVGDVCLKATSSNRMSRSAGPLERLNPSAEDGITEEQQRALEELFAHERARLHAAGLLPVEARP